jgi:hypothetical protein
MRDKLRTMKPVLGSRRFGPFLNVPAAEVDPAGFNCQRCNRAVEVLRKVMPGVVPRMILHSCPCQYMTVTWEDEGSPRNARAWRSALKLMKRAGVQVLAINRGDKGRPGFIGPN